MADGPLEECTTQDGGAHELSDPCLFERQPLAENGCHSQKSAGEDPRTQGPDSTEGRDAQERGDGQGGGGIDPRLGNPRHPLVLLRGRRRTRS